MKRFHVHLSVPDLAASIRFYSGLFGMQPSVTKHDYAKWMLDDPRVNFAISQRGKGTTGLNHLGLQADSEDELAAVRHQFDAADASTVIAESGARCCYARSNKHWVQDPQGIPWEAFHTLDSIPVWGGASEPTQATDADGCCSPAEATGQRGEPARVSATAARCCAPSAAATRSSCC